MRTRRMVELAVVAVAVGALLAAPSAASAGATGGPVGTLTATQVPGPCGDLGAAVEVSVTSGLASTSYLAVGDQNTIPAEFATDGTGAGTGTVFNVRADARPTWEGPATITVSAGGESDQVVAYISCQPPHGKDRIAG